MTVEPTELVELDVEKVSGVETPANGTTFLVLKASDSPPDGMKECPTCNGTAKIMDGNRDCPDCENGYVKKAEADEIEDEMTGDDGDAEKAAMSSASQNDLPDSAFAYIEPGGKKDTDGKTTPRSKRHFPVHDEAHARNALARLSQSPFGDKAKRKVHAAAKKFGIDVAAKAEVEPMVVNLVGPDPADVEKFAAAVIEELRKSPGVPDESVATPVEAGHDTSMSQSKAGDTVTSTAGSTDTDPAKPLGGESPYEIAAEDRLDLSGTTKKAFAFAVSSLAEFVDRLQEQRDLIERATKAGMTIAPPKPDETASPGDMPWESYDSASLSDVAMMLQHCCCALDALAMRERIEAVAADPGDLGDAWDLGDAEQALEYALGIVARLSFGEAAEAMAAKAEMVEKVGRRISGKTEGVLRAARDHLTSVIGDGDEQKAGGSPDSEGDKIEMEMTKSEFAESIVAIAREVMKENANNNGDVSEGDLHPGSTQDANDLSLNGANTDKPGVTKEQQDQEEQDVAKQLQELTKQVGDVSQALGSVGELVTKMAQRPRQGGPRLDGQLPPGFTPAAEGRQSETVQKSEDDQKIEQLQKQLGEASSPQERDWISQDLTLAKLAAAHRAGVA